MTTHKIVQTETKIPDPHQDVFSKNVLGFWIYLMTDCLLFGTLFATYAVLHNSTFGGPTTKDLFHIPGVALETAVLLISSITYGLSTLASCRNDKKNVLMWMIITFILGATFVGLEIAEFAQMIREGASFTKSAFLSSFFTLVGTHGAHVSIGLLWMLIMMFQIGFYGITTFTFRRLVILGMFWHFLDLIWIFIFTFVYLIGVI